MNIKNKFIATAITTLMLGTSCYAKLTQIEEKYWDDFTKSNQGIVQYVHNLSATDVKAATWFLTTGGKDGFSSRQATDEEANLLKGAVKKIAVAAGNAIDNGKEIEDWAPVGTLSAQGSLYLEMIYGEINSLSKGITHLWQEVGAIRKEQQIIGSRIESLENDINDLKSCVSKLEADNKIFKKELDADHQDFKKKLGADHQDFKKEMEKIFEDHDNARQVMIKEFENNLKKQFDDHQAEQEQIRQDRLLQEKKNTETYKARISSLGIKSQLDQEFLLSYLELNWETSFNIQLDKILKAQEKTLKEEAQAKAKEEAQAKKEEENKQRIELYKEKIDLLGLQDETHKKILLGLIESNLIKEYDEAVKWMVKAQEKTLKEEAQAEAAKLAKEAKKLDKKAKAEAARIARKMEMDLSMKETIDKLKEIEKIIAKKFPDIAAKVGIAA